ncbi:hypothetical protein [Paenibacillus sp. RUD330]|uniref:hypothetical protein n=1 Tax=Paenibacillus sp. RUD330 TaxID=2023772 RepID=UPI0013B47D13|nr:hypothetical protein [Paenibacillus sp. RUD330]QID16083.1 hypothetical protein CIC07_25495 [Paenibacillus sp. RUD330]
MDIRSVINQLEDFAMEHGDDAEVDAFVLLTPKSPAGTGLVGETDKNSYSEYTTNGAW